MKKNIKSTISNKTFLFLFGFFVAFFAPNINADMPKQSVPAQDVETETKFIEFHFGNPNALFKVIEYASISCPACVDYHNSNFQSIKEKFINENKVHWIVRLYPMDIASLFTINLVKNCPLDKHSDFLDKIMMHSNEWENDEDSKNGLQKIANSFGIHQDYVQSSFTEEAKDQALDYTMALYKNVDIPGTPTFVVNGKQIDGILSVNDIEKEINFLYHSKNDVTRTPLSSK